MHTRKDPALDLMLTNMHEYYTLLYSHSHHLGCPIIMSWWRLLYRGYASTALKNTITKRDLRASSKASMGRFLNRIDWSILFALLEWCEEMWNTFTEAVRTGIVSVQPQGWLRGWKPLSWRAKRPLPCMGPNPLNSRTLETPLTGRGKRVEPANTNQRFNS